MTKLHEACVSGDIDTVTRLLGDGADPNQARTDGATPLYVAAGNGHLEVATLLLDRGADPNQVDADGGYTALMDAVDGGNLDIARLLLDRKADPNQAKTDGATPLMRAAGDGELDIARLLLEHGADLNKARTDGATPLMRAAEDGELDIARLLLDRGAKPNQARTDGETPLFAAAYQGHNEVVAALLAGGADPNQARTDDGATPLFTASIYGHLNVVELLANKLLKDSTAESFSYSAFSDLCRQYKLFHAADDDPEGTKNIAEAIKRIIHNPDLDINAIPMQADVRQAILRIYPQDTRGDLLALEIKKLRPNTALTNFLFENMSKEAQEYFSENLFLEKQEIMLSEIAKLEPNIELVEFLLRTMSQEGRIRFHQGQKFDTDFTDGEYNGTTPIIDAANNLGPKTGQLMRVLINNGASIDVHEAVKKSPFTYLVHRAWSIFETEAEEIRSGDLISPTGGGAANAAEPIGGGASASATHHDYKEQAMQELRSKISHMLTPTLDCLMQYNLNPKEAWNPKAAENIEGGSKTSAEEFYKFCQETGVKINTTWASQLIESEESKNKIAELEERSAAQEVKIAELEERVAAQDARMNAFEALLGKRNGPDEEPSVTEEAKSKKTKLNPEVGSNTKPDTQINSAGSAELANTSSISSQIRSK